MTRLLSEVQAIQNPALGATLLWRFACGYAPKHDPGDGVPFPLSFVVLPVVLHERTRAIVTSTRPASGVRKFEEKFDGMGDILFALNERAIDLRMLSLRSVRHALSAGLLTLVPESAALWPRSYTKTPTDAKPVSRLISAAYKLGEWCRPLSIYEISGILRVEF